MADVSSLNFDVILNDDEFQRKVKEDIKLAEDLNLKLSQALDIKGAVEKAIQSQKSLGSTIEDNAAKQEKVTDATKKTTDETKKHEDAVKGANSQLGNTATVMRTISQLTGVAFGAIGIRRFVSELASATGQFEVQKMALTSMLQDAEKADEIFNTLRKNALNSPYTFQDLTKFAKQLTAFNIPVDNLVETEKRLADVAAGLGVDMGRIILAYGQVKAAGVLKGTELRQFTEAGVPLLQSLAEQIKETEGYAISLSEVFARISKKQIPFEMVEEAFRRMTNEGGKFYNMQEVLVETLQGKISKLRDVWQQTLYDIGSNNDAILKGAVDAVTVLVSHLGDLGKILPEIVLAFGAFKATQAVVAAGGLELAIANGKVLASLRAIGKWIMTNPFAILASVVTVVGVEMYKLYKTANEGQARLTKSMKEVDSAIDEEKDKLDELKAKLELNAKGTQEWNDAKEELVKNYGKYFNGLDSEIDKVGTLETAYEDLTAAVVESVKERKVADFIQSERDVMNSTLDASIGKIRDRLYNKYDRAEAYILMSELEREIRNGGTFESYMKGSRVSSILKTGDYIGDLRQMFESQKAVQREYLHNVRTIVKEYGLQGTELDPDFVGPIPTKRTSATPTKKTQTWTPLKGGGKEIVDDWVDINQRIAEIDKENEKIFEDTLEAFVKDLDGKEKAITKFDDYIAKSSNQKSGEGAFFKLSGLIADKQNDDKKAVDEYKDNLNELKEAFGSTSDYFTRRKGDLDNALANVLAGNRAEFLEKVRGLADDIFKEGMSGYDMTNWAEKTLGQIRDIKSALMKLDVPDSIKEILDDETLTKLEDALQAIVDAKLDNTVAPEEMKALKREAGYALDKVSSLAEALAEVSDTDFGDTIKGVSEIGDIAKEALGAFKEFGGKGGGGTAAAMGWIAAVVALNMKVLQLAAMEEAQARRERSAIRDARSTGRLQDTEQGSFFGVSSTALLDSRIRQINRISEAIDKYRDSAEDFTVTTDKVGFWKKALGWMNMENWRTGSYLPDTTYSLSALAEGLGMQLYDEYGNLNAVTLKAILDSYEDIQEEEREWIEQAIHDSEDYAEAMADVKEMLDGVFGDIASQAADNIIDQWIQAGDAALDYADILDDVARRYAKMLVESAILDKVLNKEEADRIADMFVNGRADEAMAAIAGDMQKIADMEPLFGQIMSVFDPYFNRSSSTGSSSLGSGIKSITEETASLLASYINAIRADVSYIRSMYESNTEGVAALGQSLPTLNEYMAQIAATNFDIAQSNQRILSELQSVIGAPGTSGMVVRVEYV